MKALALTLMMIVLFCSTFIQADYPEVEISVGMPGNQTNPDISGKLVVWEDDFKGASNIEIYWKYFGDPDDPNMFEISANQEIPAVSEDTIVWQDYQSSKRNIYAYNLLSTSYLPVPINDGFHQRYPDISGDVIVWQDYRNGDTDIYMYNIVKESEAAVYNDGTETWGQYSPAVDGDVVVWMDNRNPYQIYMSDISGPIPSVPQVVNASTDNQWRPAVSGNLIVWEELDASNSVTLVAYDLVSSGVIWNYAVTGTQANAAVSDGIIVWQELRSGGSDYNIRAYNTTSGAYLDIATANQNDENPAISGRRVVWQRNGTDIVGAEIPLPTMLEVTIPAAGEMYLAGTQINIEWQMVSGAAPDFVNIDFSSNNGSSWDIVCSNVPFTDYDYLWTLMPDANEIDSCQIRVSDALDSMTSDISENFSIFQCDADLISDLNGDCFVDIEDLAELTRQWLTCGNPYDTSWCIIQ